MSVSGFNDTFHLSVCFNEHYYYIISGHSQEADITIYDAAEQKVIFISGKLWSSLRLVQVTSRFNQGDLSQACSSDDDDENSVHHVSTYPAHVPHGRSLEHKVEVRQVTGQRHNESEQSSRDTCPSGVHPRACDVLTSV